jgi:hypothetical protein
MRRTSRSALILCLASTASLAQISLRDILFVPLEANCPIGMQATLEKGGNLLATQRLQVILTKWPSFDIVASRITVHGIAPVANRPQPSEITESLDLNRIVDRPTPTASTGNAPQAPTEPKETLAGQGQMPGLDEILRTIGTGPVLVRGHSRDSRWYAWVSGFTAVSIDLESVSYADGTSWHASNGTPCRVSVVPSVW